MIFYTIYTSTPRLPMTQEVLDDITSVSIRSNKRDGITGMLLGIEGKYLQYLEGAESKVNALFERIKKDGRHHEVNQWVKGFTEKRIFTEWSMGSWMLDQHTLTHLTALNDLKTFINNPSNEGSQSLRFLQMMHGLLKTWINHEPERAIRLKS